MDLSILQRSFFKTSQTCLFSIFGIHKHLWLWVQGSDTIVYAENKGRKHERASIRSVFSYCEANEFPWIGVYYCTKKDLVTWLSLILLDHFMEPHNSGDTFLHEPDGLILFSSFHQNTLASLISRHFRGLFWGQMCQIKAHLTLIGKVTLLE